MIELHDVLGERMRDVVLVIWAYFLFHLTQVWRLTTPMLLSSSSRCGMTLLNYRLNLELAN